MFPLLRKRIQVQHSSSLKSVDVYVVLQTFYCWSFELLFFVAILFPFFHRCTKSKSCYISNLSFFKCRTCIFVPLPCCANQFNFVCDHFNPCQYHTFTTTYTYSEATGLLLFYLSWRSRSTGYGWILIFEVSNNEPWRTRTRARARAWARIDHRYSYQ
jgi:hypothetical protein